MNFEHDIFKLKKAIGKDTDLFIDVFNNLNEKYPNKKDLIIDLVEKELAQKSKIADGFIEAAKKIVFPETVFEEILTY